MDTESFLSNLHNRLDAFRRAREHYAPQLAPAFNGLSLVKPKEPAISAILADLLSPSGDHRQGAIFLELFLRRIGLEKPYLDVEIDTAQTTVTPEEPTNEKRKVDLVINFGQGRGIGIENKPREDSRDLDNQVSAYLKYLSDKFPHRHCLIYLSAKGTRPESNSIPAEQLEEALEADKIKLVSYSVQIIEWLHECKSRCKAERVSHFLDEFIDYIQKKIMGIEDMQEQNEIMEAAMKNSNSLEAALHVGMVFDEIKSTLYKRLCSALQQLASVKGWKFHPELDPCSTNGTYFNFYLPGWSQYSVSFQFKGTNYLGLVYGIAKEDPKLPKNDAVTKCLNERFEDSLPETGEKKWWLWHQDFPDERERDWRTSVSPWVEIHSDKMAGKIVGLVDDILAALKARNLTAVLKSESDRS